MRKLSTLIVLILLFLALPPSVSAKKKLPTRSAGTATSVTRGVATSVKFRGDRRAIVANFSNLGIASSVSYSLSYVSRGINQGAGGSILPTEASATRELIFGTCSAGICRYDTGITNAKFVVTTTLKNGRKIMKTFRLRV